MNDQAIETIRRAELEVARRVEAARERAEQVVADARSEASRLNKEAEQRGRAHAQERFDAAEAAADEEAARIRTDGHDQAAQLRELAAPHVADLAERLLMAVLPPAPEWER